MNAGKQRPVLGWPALAHFAVLSWPTLDASVNTVKHTCIYKVCSSTVDPYLTYPNPCLSEPTNSVVNSLHFCVNLIMWL